MSKYTQKQAVTVSQILQAKADARRLSMVTCYDFAFAKLVDQTAIDIVLVGDSLGNIMLGFDSTIPVTVDHMVHHTAAVARALTRPFLCADMPFLSYHLSPEQALTNAGRLIQAGGAQGVKVEGGSAVAGHVRRLVDAGIPVMGHLGLTPQSLHILGGYRVQGRGAQAQEALLADAHALEEAGVFAVVLEMVPATLAARLTKELKVPTIGIGAGANCDGQVLVLHDILGFDAAFQPKFLKKYADLGRTVTEALAAYDRDVKDGSFPALEHSFKD